MPSLLSPVEAPAQRLEEAKLRRQPPEKELSRLVVVVVGAGSGIGRATALEAARRGAHLVAADVDLEQAERTAAEARQHAGKEGALALRIDLRDRATIRSALREVVAAYGESTCSSTPPIFPSSASGHIDDAAWATTFDINVTANHRLAEEAAAILREQGLETSIVLTSSANAVVAKRGSEAYDVSKAALSHLVRELATSLAPSIRVNAVSPATVVSGSAMFGRDRVRASLEKYAIPFDPNASDAELGALLAEFYSRRSLTKKSIQPSDCAQAILFLAGPHAPCTTGHVFPVDGGLTEAFLR